MIFKTKKEIFDLNVILLDLNWTISVFWNIIDWVWERIEKLKKLWFDCYIVSWDQRWKWESIANKLWIKFFLANSEEEKAIVTKNFKKDSIISIWNARIDNWMFENSKLRIWVLQKEWMHIWIMKNIDIIFTNVNDALDMLLDENIFLATMK